MSSDVGSLLIIVFSATTPELAGGQAFSARATAIAL